MAVSNPNLSGYPGGPHYRATTSQPVYMAEWHDPKSPAKGWLVVDRRVNGIAGGGVFMWHDATVEETAGIAHTMSKKFAICPRPIGGAKAGIRCDLKSSAERNAVLRRFLEEMRNELRHRWVTAGDYGTSDRVVEQAVRDLTGQDMQWALYRHAAQDEGHARYLSSRAPDLYQTDMASAFLAEDAPRPQFSIPFIEAAVGFGVVQSIVKVYEALEPRRVGSQSPLEDVRIAVQGAGAVGTGVMLYASRLGAEIVAVSDGEGILYDPEGLDVELLLSLRACAVNALPEEARPAAGKLLCRYLPKAGSGSACVVWNAQVEATTAGRSTFLDAKLGHLAENTLCANVFVPAASRYLWNRTAVELAANGMWKGANHRLVVAGANNMFGVANSQGPGQPPTAADLDLTIKGMQNSRVIYVPDFRVNGGTAQLFHCYAAGEIGWILEGTSSGIPTLSAGQQERALQEVSKRIKDEIEKDLQLCAPPFLELPARAEERVAEQLKDPRCGWRASETSRQKPSAPGLTQRGRASGANGS